MTVSEPTLSSSGRANARMEQVPRRVGDQCASEDARWRHLHASCVQRDLTYEKRKSSSETPRDRTKTQTSLGSRSQTSGSRRCFDSAMSAADANARLALAVSTIAFGYFLKRVGLVDVDVGKAMLKVLFNATLPAMLLMTFASLTFDATSVAVSLCAMAQAAVLFVAHLAFKGTGRDPKDTALLAGSCVGVNLGTFAYPLVEAVWGTAGVTRLACSTPSTNGRCSSSLR